MLDIICRPLKDGESILASEIERECLETPWSESQILDMPPYGIYVGAFSDNTLCGIGSMYCIAGEAQIMNIAVATNFRKMGVALKLMNYLFRQAENNNCKIITLEVAENNIAAISLYEKCGFCPVGTRKGFYKEANAIIMEKTL